MAQGLIILKWQLNNASQNPYTHNATPKLDWPWFYQRDAISHNFPQSLQAKSKILLDMRTQPLPYTSFPVQYSRSHNHFTSLTMLWSNKPKIRITRHTANACRTTLDSHTFKFTVCQWCHEHPTSCRRNSSPQSVLSTYSFFIFYHILFKDPGRTAL